MSTPKFAETHNLVAFLEKPTESEGFEQITDFLNANPIKYALTVNPTTYTLCIKQFWATAMVKTVDGEQQIQALVDKKKVIITETNVSSDIHLEDAECLPTAIIFEQLTLMGYGNLTQKLTFYKAFLSPQWKFLIHTILQCISAKTTAWNEFSSTMAFAINCLSTNQKFNFSKFIFDHMVKNLEDGVKFLKFPRFVQVFMDSQIKDEHVTTTSNDPLSGEDRLKLTKLMKLYTKLQLRVLVMESIKVDQALKIGSLKRKVKKLEKKASKKTHKLKRLYKIGSSTRVESSKDSRLGDQEDASKQERMIADLEFVAKEVVSEKEVSTTDPVPNVGEVVTTAGVEVSVAAITSQISMNEITLAKSLIDIKTSKPKAKGIRMKEPSETPTPTLKDNSQQSSKAIDKDKAKMIEPEKHLKRKDQIMIDEEIAT
nr:hypothetical protein [Tanacetum cinerariifolium]